jgi:hypothetical protein
MQYIVIGKEKNELVELTLAMKKQEKWRQRQIDIYYRLGRPIFENIKQYNTIYGRYRK